MAAVEQMQEVFGHAVAHMGPTMIQVAQAWSLSRVTN